MGKRLIIATHLPVELLEQYYRQANDPVARSQWQILWLLASGKVSGEVSEVTSYSLDWIRKLARRYNSSGPLAVGDSRRQNPGQAPLLNDEHQAHLLQALQGIAPGGGKWNGPKVAYRMSQLLGRAVAPQRGWEYLRAMEYRLKVPRPAHVEAEEVAQELWKKT